MRALRNRFAEPVFTSSRPPLRRAIALGIEAAGRWFRAEALPYIELFAKAAVLVALIGCVCGLLIGLAR